MQSCPDWVSHCHMEFQGEPRAQHSAGNYLPPIQQKQIYQWHAKHKFALIQET